MDPEDLEKYLNKYMDKNIDLLVKEYPFSAQERYFKKLRTNQFKPEIKSRIYEHKQEIRKIMG